jgi:hypothetical protein
VPAGVPWKGDFKFESFNYSPLVLLIGVIVGIWWWISAKDKYNGPVRTIDTDDLGHVIEEPAVGAGRPPEPGPPPVGPEPTPAS